MIKIEKCVVTSDESRGRAEGAAAPPPEML